MALGFLAGLAAPLVSGALGFAGQSSTNAANAAEAARTRDFNAAEAEKNRRFQDEQSSTAYQRAVKDLEAAGLNPALAYQQGGASSGSGSAASGPAARFDSSAGAGISSAASTSQFLQQAATMSAQRDEILARAQNTRAQTERTNLLMAAEENELFSRTRQQGSAAARNEQETSKLRLQYDTEVPLRRAQIRSYEASASSALQSARESEVRTQLGRYDLNSARNVSEAADSFFMRRIAPYLGSAKQVTDLVNPLSRFRSLKGR